MLSKVKNFLSKNEISLLPFETFEISTNKSAQEIKEDLSEHLLIKKNLGIVFFQKNTDKKYEGYVDKESFKLRRILKGGRNSFIPIVSGKIKKRHGKTTMEMKIRLHRFVYIFLSCFIAFALVLIGIQLFHDNSFNPNYFSGQEVDLDELKSVFGEEKYEKIFLQKRELFNPWFLSIFIIWPYLFSTIAFNIESRKVKKFLRKIAGEFQ